FRWVNARRVTDFARMSDLALAARERLANGFEVAFPEVAERRLAGDGTTRYVHALRDGERSESVYIPGASGQATLCLSSQVGCPLACSFCVSGLLGVKRNLDSAEIVGQA